MTREQALALARLFCELDAVPLLEPIRAEQRSRGARRVWSIFSNYTSTGKNVGLVIDDLNGVIIQKQYVGFGDRQGQPFGGEQYSREFSVIEREQIVAAPRAAVFELFADAAQHRALSPPSLLWLSPTEGALRAGARLALRLRLRLRAVDVELTLRVTRLSADEGLLLAQERGPLRHLQYALELKTASGATLIRERLEYRLRFGLAGQLAFVLLGFSRELEALLTARHDALAARFGLGLCAPS